MLPTDIGFVPSEVGPKLGGLFFKLGFMPFSAGFVPRNSFPACIWAENCNGERFRVCLDSNS